MHTFIHIFYFTLFYRSVHVLYPGIRYKYKICIDVKTDVHNICQVKRPNTRSLISILDFSAGTFIFIQISVTHMVTDLFLETLFLR